MYIFLSKAPQKKYWKVESVGLSIRNQTNCGGKEIYVQLYNNSKNWPQGENFCYTENLDFSKGENKLWTGKSLGCKGNYFFDSQNDTIEFNFNSTDTFGNFCPKVLTITLKNGDVYSNSDEMNDWFSPQKGGDNRIAKKLKGNRSYHKGAFTYDVRFLGR